MCLRLGAHLYSKNVFCLNMLECVFPLFNIGVPHTYAAKKKNTIQHDPAHYSRIEHARSRNTDHCLKTKHFLVHAPLTLRCLCQCNLQYIRPGTHTAKMLLLKPKTFCSVKKKKLFCLNMLECVFPLFNIGVPHTYTAKNKTSYSTIQHITAESSMLEAEILTIV